MLASPLWGIAPFGRSAERPSIEGVIVFVECCPEESSSAAQLSGPPLKAPAAAVTVTLMPVFGRSAERPSIEGSIHSWIPCR